jgi:hypothetical protein
MAMFKKNYFCCFLLAFLMAFGGLASANPPYASILAFTGNAYNVGVKGPNLNLLNTLNIINLTPWEIYFGNPQTPNGVDILYGFGGPAPGLLTGDTKGKQNYRIIPTAPFWLKGINGVVDSSKSGSAKSTGFAFHSVQIGLGSPGSEWIQATSCTTAQASSQSNACYNSFDLTKQALSPAGLPNNNWAYFLAQTGYLTVPIIFNSSNGMSGGANTAAMNFMVTSSNGYAVAKSKGTLADSWKYEPALALGFGDGSNNYTWATKAFYDGSAKDAPAQTQLHSVSQFLTIQAAGSNAGQWVPVPTAIGGIATPAYLNTGALAYPNFSGLSGVSAVAGVEYDLVVMLQSGDYANLSLIFLATPSSPSSAVKRK